MTFDEQIAIKEAEAQLNRQLAAYDVAELEILKAKKHIAKFEETMPA